MLPKIGFIDSYALMMVLGIVASISIYLLYFHVHLKKSFRETLPLDACLLLSISLGIIGAYLFQNLYDFIASPSTYSWSWNMTFYGGLIVGVGTFLLLYRFVVGKDGKGLVKPLLIIAPSSIAMGHAIGRIGCFLAGCCYGIHTDSFLGVHFQNVEGKVLPTNLYEAIFLFALSFILLYFAFRKDSPYCFVIYLFAYGLWRFVIEFFRGDDRGSFIPFLSPSQFWSLILIIGGIIYLAYLMKKSIHFSSHNKQG